MILRIIGFFLWASFPLIASAAPVINEIAWMGSPDSSSDEWIELYNDSDLAFDLTGWILSATDGSPSISLSGTISPREYFLIERTDDTAVPSVAADLISPFGSGLSNSGETLILRDATGGSVDEVVGGGDWSTVGGNNMTKETAQRTVSGWVTGTGTPKSKNVSPSPTQTPQNTNEQGTTTAQNTSGSLSTGGAPWVSSSPYPRENILAIAPADTRGYVGGTTTFVGDARGLFDEPIPHATYHWNFGDGTTQSGRVVAHRYSYPGTYSAILEVAWGEKHAVDRLRVIITSSDVMISSVGTSSEAVTILTNTATQEVNLSGWMIAQDGKTLFLFPPNSILFGKESLYLPHQVSGVHIPLQHIELLYPNGEIADHYEPILQKEAPTREERPPRVLGVSAQHALSGVLGKPSLAEDTPRPEIAAPIVFEEKGHTATLPEIVFSPWIFFLGMLILLGASATLYVKSLQPISEAEKYEIVEDVMDDDVVK